MKRALIGWLRSVDPVAPRDHEGRGLKPSMSAKQFIGVAVAPRDHEGRGLKRGGMCVNHVGGKSPLVITRGVD